MDAEKDISGHASSSSEPTPHSLARPRSSLIAYDDDAVRTGPSGSAAAPAPNAVPAADLSDIDAVLASLALDEDGRDSMFRSLVPKFQAALQQGDIDPSQFPPDALWTALRQGDASEGQGVPNLASLATTHAALAQMLRRGSRSLVAMAQILADASREREISRSLERVCSAAGGEAEPCSELTLRSRMASSLRRDRHLRPPPRHNCIGECHRRPEGSGDASHRELLRRHR